VQVSVTNISSGKVSANTLPFQYGQSMFISGFSPMQGPANAATTVTITGQGFVAPVSVIYDPTGAQLAWTVLSVAGTQVVAQSVPLASAHQCSGGSAILRVTNLDSNLHADSTQSFAYQGVQPLITSAQIGTSNIIQQAPCGGAWTSHTVTIKGSGFAQSGVTVSFGGLPAIPATWVDANTITVQLPDLTAIPIHTTTCMSGTQQGKVNIATPINVTVTNSANSCTDTLAAAMIIQPCDTTTCKLGPVITTISPKQGTMSGGTGVSIIGQNFVCPVTVLFGGGSVIASGCSATLLSVTSPALTGGTAGQVDVTVVNTGGDTATSGGGFTYTAMLNATVLPNSSSGDVSGTGLQTSAIGNLTATPTGAGTFGSWGGACLACGAATSCAVTMNADPRNCTATFLPPAVSSLDVTTGPVAGGTVVTVTGTGFANGAGVTFGGSAATGVTFVNSTTITCTTPAHAAGAVNVVVTNPDTQTGTLTNGFTYS
jgi:hypothetical protein